MGQKTQRSSWVLPAMYLTILCVAWGAVLVIKGTVGPYGWWLLMVFGIVALFTALICVVAIVVKMIRRHRVHLSLTVLLLLSLVAGWPGCWLFGIAQIAYPADRNSVSPAVSIRLPVNEPALVGWGGDTLRDNYHVWLPVERWAYDLLVLPALLDSSNLDDFGIYGMEIVAPISGLIVGAYDGYPDETPGTDKADNMGNYIYIRIESTGTYLVISHIKQGSLLVEEGQYIEEGTPIARAGNSGMSSEPHIHIHHQRQNPTQRLLLAEGLPLYFRDIEGSPMPKGGGHRIVEGFKIPNGDIITPINR